MTKKSKKKPSNLKNQKQASVSKIAAKERGELLEKTAFVTVLSNVANVLEKLERAASNSEDTTPYHYCARQAILCLRQHRLWDSSSYQAELSLLDIPVEDTLVDKSLKMCKLLDLQWEKVQNDPSFTSLLPAFSIYVKTFFTSMICLIMDENELERSSKDVLEHEAKLLKEEELKKKEVDKLLQDEDAEVEISHKKEDEDRLQEEDDGITKESDDVIIDKEGGESRLSNKIRIKFIQNSSEVCEDGHVEGYGTMNKYNKEDQCYYESYPKGSIDIDNYLRNLELLKFDTSILGFEGHFEDENSGNTVFVFESYLNSIKDFQNDFWEEKGSRGCYGFSRFGYKTVTQMLMLMEKLAKRGIKIAAFTSKTVVFTRNNESTPKLRRILSEWKGQSQNTKSLHKYYRRMLKNMIEDLSTHIELTPDVNNFLNCLTESKMSNKKLSEHPAFWSVLDNLRYIVEIRNKLRFEELNKMHFWKYYQHESKSWIEIFKEIEPLRVRVEKCENELMKKGVSSEALFIRWFFIRDSFEHMNDGQITKFPRAEIEAMFEEALPNLVTDLYSMCDFVFPFTGVN